MYMSVGGYTVALDDIIQEDYYSIDNNNSYTMNINVCDEDEDDSSMDVNSSKILERSHTLEESLLPLSPSHSSSSINNNNNVNHNDATSMDNSDKLITTLRKRNKNKYLQILTSLYWQQWLIRKKFQKSNLLEHWNDYSLLYKITIIITYPIILLRDCTIPTVDKDNWSKYHAMLQLLLSPLLFLFIINGLYIKLFNLSLWLISIYSSIIPSLCIYFFTNHSTPPLKNLYFITTWTCLSFIMCIIWIYLLAKELITCLSALGIILSIGAYWYNNKKTKLDDYIIDDK